MTITKKEYYYIAASAGGQYEANPVLQLDTRAGMIGGITRFDPAQKNYLEWAHKVCNFLSMSTVESKADRAQSKQRKHKRLPWVYCATNSWLSFLSLEISKSWFVIKRLFFWNLINLLLTKLVKSR